MSGKQPGPYYVGRHEQLWSMSTNERNTMQTMFFEMAQAIREDVGTSPWFHQEASRGLGRDDNREPGVIMNPPVEDRDLRVTRDPWSTRLPQRPKSPTNPLARAGYHECVWLRDESGLWRCEKCGALFDGLGDV